MESSALYGVARLRGVRAGMICACSSNLVDGASLYSGAWDALRAGCTADLTFVDHRPAGYGEQRSAEYFMQFCRSIAEVDSGFVEISNLLDSGERLALLSSEPVLTCPAFRPFRTPSPAGG